MNHLDQRIAEAVLWECQGAIRDANARNWDSDEPLTCQDFAAEIVLALAKAFLNPEKAGALADLMKEEMK
jgi:hypothetical protein